MRILPTLADQILRVMCVCVVRCENSKLIFYKSIEFEYIFFWLENINFLLICVRIRCYEQFDVILLLIGRCRSMVTNPNV